MGISDNNLAIQSLSLCNFRNYPTLEISDFSNLNIFIGPNAVGKTTIIEGIQLLTALTSFRTSKFQQVIAWGNRTATLTSRLQSATRTLEEKLQISEGKRQYFLNGNKRQIKDLKGQLPSVSFNPDDLYLVKGSHFSRLAMVDNIGTQLSKNFYTVKQDYLKLIRQKNKALKEEAADTYIESINDVLSKVGAQYISHRLHILERLRQLFHDHYRHIANNNERVDIAYIYSWDKPHEEKLLSTHAQNQTPSNKQDILHQLQDSLHEYRVKEQQRQTSLIGPHADHLIFLLNQKNALHYASQGQQRTIVLALKLAELLLIQEILHQKPVLLLDDVMSELDEQRRKYFLGVITNDIQTFITTTNSEYFDQNTLQRSQIYQLPLPTT